MGIGQCVSAIVDSTFGCFVMVVYIMEIQNVTFSFKFTNEIGITVEYSQLVRPTQFSFVEHLYAGLEYDTIRLSKSPTCQKKILFPDGESNPGRGGESAES